MTFTQQVNRVDLTTEEIQILYKAQGVFEKIQESLNSSGAGTIEVHGPKNFIHDELAEWDVADFIDQLDNFTRYNI